MRRGLRWTARQLAAYVAGVVHRTRPARPAPGRLQAGVEWAPDVEAALDGRRTATVWLEADFRALPMKELYRCGWVGEYHETRRWQATLESCAWLLPQTVRGRLAATTPREVRIIRSYRAIPLDDDNLQSIRKPILDALVRLRWLVDDGVRVLDCEVRQAQDARPYTEVRFGPVEAHR